MLCYAHHRDVLLVKSSDMIIGSLSLGLFLLIIDFDLLLLHINDALELISLPQHHFALLYLVQVAMHQIRYNFLLLTFNLQFASQYLSLHHLRLLRLSQVDP